MPDSPASGSGEYSALLLSAINQLRDDHREFRVSISSKMDTQGGQIQEILVSLADGTGRMNVMQQTIDMVRTNTEAHAERLRSIESGSGIHQAVARLTSESSTTDDDKPRGGWISADKLPAIITAIGSIIAVVVSSIALMKAPAQPPTIPTQPPAVHAP